MGGEKFVMDKIFIVNVYVVFTAVRLRINQPDCIELLRVLRDNLASGGDNESFISNVQVSETLKDVASEIGLHNETSAKIKIAPAFSRLYVYISDVVIKLLEEHSFEQAYDIIDAFHWLPESLANERKVDYVEFFVVYVMPLGEKWGKDLVNELLRLLPVSRLTRTRIWSKLKIAQLGYEV